MHGIGSSNRSADINAALVTRELAIASRNVNRYIEPIATAGILTEFTEKRRNRAWRSVEVRQALDAFAACAGHRTTP